MCIRDRPITAEQFVYSFQRLLDPNTGATEYDNFLSIVNAQEISDGTVTDLSQLGVKAEDEKTLVVTLSRMSPTFISASHPAAACIRCARSLWRNAELTTAPAPIITSPAALIRLNPGLWIPNWSW